MHPGAYCTLLSAGIAFVPSRGPAAASDMTTSPSRIPERISVYSVEETPVVTIRFYTIPSLPITQQKEPSFPVFTASTGTITAFSAFAR